MARPQKKGLDYFPLDVELFSDIKIKIVRGRYGSDGVLLFIYLLCEIYKNGYYIIFNDDLLYVIMADLNMSEEKTRQIINFLLERSLFNDKLFKSDKVLTAKSIQRRYQEARKGAKRDIEVEEKFWVLEKAETLSFIKMRPVECNSANNSYKSKNNPCNSENNSIKESKEKKSKVKESKEEYAPHVFLSKTDYQFLIDNYGETAAKRMIEILNDYKEAKGVKYESDIAAIRKWVISAYQEEQTKKPIKDKQSYDIDDIDSLAINMRGVNK